MIIKKSGNVTLRENIIQFVIMVQFIGMRVQVRELESVMKSGLLACQTALMAICISVAW